MKVELHYGKGLLSLNIPQPNIAAVIRPWHKTQKQDNAAVINKALSGRGLNEFQAKIKGKGLCVLLDDATRNVPLHAILPLLSEKLRNAAKIQFIICTGTHNPQTPEKITIADGANKLALYPKD